MRKKIMLEILRTMKADKNVLIAAVVSNSREDGSLSMDAVNTLFGEDVSVLLKGYEPIESESWREQRQSLIDAVRFGDVRKKMLALAEIMADMRCYSVKDAHEKSGIQKELNVGKIKSSWYYSKILDAVDELQMVEQAEKVYWEAIRMYKDLFVQYYVDETDRKLYQISEHGENAVLTLGSPNWDKFTENLPKAARLITRDAAEQLEDEENKAFWEMHSRDMEDGEYLLYNSADRTFGIFIENQRLSFWGEDARNESKVMNFSKRYRFTYELGEDDTHRFLVQLRMNQGLDRSLAEILTDAFGYDSGALYFLNICHDCSIPYTFASNRYEDEMEMTENEFLEGNEQIEYAILECKKDPSDENHIAVLETIRQRMKEDGHFLLPIETPEELISKIHPDIVRPGDEIQYDEDIHFRLRTVEMRNGQEAVAVFTNEEEVRKGSDTSIMSNFMEVILKDTLLMEGIEGMIINPWGEAFYLPKEWIRTIFRVEEEKKKMHQIQIEMGDITKKECDCIVNAANESLLGGGGVDGAIHRAAGAELLAECRLLGGCRTGEAKITAGYHLKARYIIHTVGPIYSGRDEDSVLLRNCYWNSLELAKMNEIHSMAFPAISTGVYGYPLEEAVPIAMETVSKWLNKNPTYQMEITMMCFDQRTYDVYQEYMEKTKD